MASLNDFQTHFELKDWKHIVAYSFWDNKWYWLSFNDKFEEVAQMLLKCNEDRKDIQRKLNRSLWIANTWFGDILWMTKKRNELLWILQDVMLQMNLVVEAVSINNRKMFAKLEKDPLTSKLFIDDNKEHTK